MAEQKKYWKSLEEREQQAPDSANEFAEAISGTSRPFARRDFLKAAGFTAALATFAGCSRAPVQKAIPFLIEPEEIVPGRALYYASTCAGCAAGCGVLVKNRDGRPIKLEGNPQQPMSRGGLCAVGQASILGLYDSHRLREPLIGGKPAQWQEVDRRISEQLHELRSVRFLSGTITSPTLRASIADFLTQFPDAKHVSYDVLSASAILEAHERTHAARVLPHYRFDKADVIVSFDADFLGTWISPVEFAADYASGRKLSDNRLSYHVQFEPRMSLTGTKADRRFAIAPGEFGLLLTHVATRIGEKSGTKFAAHADAPPVDAEFLDDLADRLWAARGRSLVVCGSTNLGEQLLANYINHLLGNYGATLDMERPSHQRAGNDRALALLIDELNAGSVDALFILGANPAYDLLNAFTAALKRVPMVVSFAERLDETAARAHFVCPDHHYLESWSDAEPIAGVVSVIQPVVRPLGQTRSILESLAAWSGNARSQYEILRASWAKRIFPCQKAEKSFDVFWDKSVHDGFAEVEPEATKPKPFDVAAVRPIVKATQSDMAVALYAKPGMLDGRQAYNPFLQELPDPVSKTTWDNYACLSPATAARLQLQQGDLVRIETATRSTLELPVYVQPGQHDNIVAVALGYGSQLSARFANLGPRWMDAQPSVGPNGLVGVNAAPLLVLAEGMLSNWQPAQLTKTGKARELASTQTHNSLTVPAKLAPPDGKRRPIVQETTLAAYLKDPHAGVDDHEEKEDLWPDDHPYPGPRWGMVVDLNACTGCSACVVACQVENNIPVVGRDEIRRNREMHWLRIDRYYSEQDGEIETVHQPMICQQCENAPCETVCPVLATVHSEDGLNEQVYNRCVGTRYCANNCPYKARRFNWFAYSHDDAIENLLLNPDVAVRTRGVMEKCTFCVQRIQEAKIAARATDAKIADGSVQTACQESCPAGAITFGDLSDPKSSVSRAMADPRRYRVLSELNVRPAVGYKSVVRNRADARTEVTQATFKEDHHG